MRRQGPRWRSTRGPSTPSPTGTWTSSRAGPASSSASSWRILVNVEKAPLFTVPERIDLAREVFAGFPNVEIDTFGGLLVDYARVKRASVVVRGLRAVSDFEYEMQMALMNRRLNPALETVFMMPAEEYSVREFATGEGSLRAGRQHRRPGARGRRGAAAVARARLTCSPNASRRIAPSGTMAVMLEAERLRRAGVDVVDLGPGEPDFPTPSARRRRGQGGHRCRADEVHRQRRRAGTARRRAAVATARTTGSSYPASEVLDHRRRQARALQRAAVALRARRRRWSRTRRGGPTIVEQIKLADATPVVVRVHAEDGFRLRADAFIDAYRATHPRCRHQLAVQPDRGRHPRAERWRRLAEAAAARGIWVVMDLCYERLVHAAERAPCHARAGRALRATGRCSWGRARSRTR